MKVAIHISCKYLRMIYLNISVFTIGQQKLEAFDKFVQYNFWVGKKNSRVKILRSQCRRECTSIEFNDYCTKGVYCN